MLQIGRHFQVRGQPVAADLQSFFRQRFRFGCVTQPQMCLGQPIQQERIALKRIGELVRDLDDDRPTLSLAKPVDRVDDFRRRTVEQADQGPHGGQRIVIPAAACELIGIPFQEIARDFPTGHLGHVDQAVLFELHVLFPLCFGVRIIDQPTGVGPQPAGGRAAALTHSCAQGIGEGLHGFGIFGQRVGHDAQRRMLGELLRGFVPHKATQGASGLLGSPRRQLVERIAPIVLRAIAIAAEQLFDVRRIVFARPVDLHAVDQVARRQRDFDIVVQLRLIERIERIEAESSQFFLGSLPRGVFGGAQLLNQFVDPGVQIGDGLRIRSRRGSGRWRAGRVLGQHCRPDDEDAESDRNQPHHAPPHPGASASIPISHGTPPR